MSDISNEIQRFAAMRRDPGPEVPASLGRRFVKLTPTTVTIDTWVDADDICCVEQMDGWTLVRTKHGNTWQVRERAETVLVLIGARVVEHVPEV